MSKFKYWLWGVAEQKDFDRRFPRPVWRWLLRKLDLAHGMGNTASRAIDPCVSGEPQSATLKDQP